MAQTIKTVDFNKTVFIVTKPFDKVDVKDFKLEFSLDKHWVVINPLVVPASGRNETVHVPVSNVKSITFDGEADPEPAPVPVVPPAPSGPQVQAPKK